MADPSVLHRLIRSLRETTKAADAIKDLRDHLDEGSAPEFTQAYGQMWQAVVGLMQRSFGVEAVAEAARAAKLEDDLAAAGRRQLRIVSDRTDPDPGDKP
jgi:hypothetical protein